MDEYGYVKQARCRIRSVRYKDGRAPLVMLNRPGLASHRRCVRKLQDAARIIDEEGDGQITGFALVVWEKTDARRWVFAQLSPDNPVWRSQLPDHVANCFRDFASYGPW